jgi:hypothetical protein
MQTRRNALKKSAVVAGLLATTGLFPNSHLLSTKLHLMPSPSPMP